MSSPRYSSSTNGGVAIRHELGRGGEGVVFAVDGRSDFVAKIYHPEHRTREREFKLKTMMASPPEDDTRHLSPPHRSIAWPIDILYERGIFVGFLMPRIGQSPTIFQVYNPQLRDESALSFDWRHLHRVGKNLATALHALHARGYVMGDVNQKNVHVTSTALVTLVDTDSFQVRDAQHGRMFRCPVGVAEYTPPELQGLDLGSVDRETHHDSFGLAVIIFQLLMEGFHPFTGAPKDPQFSLPGGGGEIYRECIKRGIFPYQSNGTFKPPPSAPDFTALHPEVQNTFIRCFVGCHSRPASRPTPREWISILDKSEKSLIQCKINRSHWHSTHTSTCPWCKRHAKRPLPIQQPFSPSLLGNSPGTQWAPTQPVQTLAGGRQAGTQAGAARQSPGRIVPGGLLSQLYVLLGALVAVAIGMGVILEVTPSLSYVPYSPRTYISWASGPIAWGRTLGGLLGFICCVANGFTVAKQNNSGPFGTIAILLLWAIIGSFGSLFGMAGGMVLALALVGLLPLFIGIASGAAGGGLLGMLIMRNSSKRAEEATVAAMLGALVGFILGAIAWTKGNQLLANYACVPAFGWLGFALGELAAAFVRPWVSGGGRQNTVPRRLVRLAAVGVPLLALLPTAWTIYGYAVSADIRANAVATVSARQTSRVNTSTQNAVETIRDNEPVIHSPSTNAAEDEPVMDGLRRELFAASANGSVYSGTMWSGGKTEDVVVVFTEQAPDGESLKASINNPSDPKKTRLLTGKIIRGWAIELTAVEIPGGKPRSFEDPFDDFYFSENLFEKFDFQVHDSGILTNSGSNSGYVRKQRKITSGFHYSIASQGAV